MIMKHPLKPLQNQTLFQTRHGCTTRLRTVTEFGYVGEQIENVGEL